MKESPLVVYRLLFHISDRDKWSSVFGLINKMTKEIEGNKLEIIIIADVFAGAVCIACNKSLKNQMFEFVNSGQKIVVCEESIKCLNISLKSLPDFVQTVPISFPEIIRLKGEGFHYIKV
jgi:intracellular sulfur oxidation DsrE/DsrF family protein